MELNSFEVKSANSMNPIGVQNMKAIIQRNGWKEIF